MTLAQSIARLLGGTWREQPPRLEFTTQDLEQIVQPLVGSGTGALAWHRIRNSDLVASPGAAELQEAYRLHGLHAQLYGEKIKQAFCLLRGEGVEPILIKGWAAARLYCEPGLRPYSDIDLAVSPQQYSKADAILKSPDHLGHWIDLHCGLARFEDRPWDELFARSELVKLDDSEVRILAPEDHLRVLCVHFLGHGAWRPLWLCDVGAALESVTTNFDWDRCLGRDKRRAKWIACTIRLAEELLEARAPYAPLEVKGLRFPRWFIRTVLREWEMPFVKKHAPPELFRTSLKHPIRIPRALLARWPSPIEATVALRCSFNDFPRLPYQAGRYFIRLGQYFNRI